MTTAWHSVPEFLTGDMRSVLERNVVKGADVSAVWEELLVCAQVAGGIDSLQAIRYAVTQQEGLQFLRAWLEGDQKALAVCWPDWPVLQNPNQVRPEPADIDDVVITDIDIYRATLEACVIAEDSDDEERAAFLRARVDRAEFCGCPACDGRTRWPTEPICSTCQGEGFIPSALNSSLRAAQTRR